jgi:hypothetical protein
MFKWLFSSCHLRYQKFLAFENQKKRKIPASPIVIGLLEESCSVIGQRLNFFCFDLLSSKFTLF